MNLPFILEDINLEPNSNWLNFIRLVKITNITFSYSFTKDVIIDLKILISEYLENHVKLYNSTLTPKMHFLVHFPTQMLQFGPLRHHACLRLEGKHGLIKEEPYNNFINIAKSVSYRHQLWMWSKQNHDSYLSDKDSFKIQENIALDNNLSELLRPYESLMFLKSIKKKGFQYKSDSFVIINITN